MLCIVPAYSYLHMDDLYVLFEACPAECCQYCSSWGSTRKVVGDKGEDHGDKAGEFDSTHIVMKRWAEFERERRWKASGMHSRDSTYEIINRAGSPKRHEANRYSFGSCALLPAKSNIDTDSTTQRPKRHTRLLILRSTLYCAILNLSHCCRIITRLRTRTMGLGRCR